MERVKKIPAGHAFILDKQRRFCLMKGMSDKAKPEEKAVETPDALELEIAGLSLEKCFEELENIVTSLENQTTSLEDSIGLFERGMKLSKRCNTELSRMERRIQLIIEDAKDARPEKGSKPNVRFREFEEQ